LKGIHHERRKRLDWSSNRAISGFETVSELEQSTDWLAGIVGAFLGQYLFSGFTRPSEFGTIFRGTFQHGFCEVFPNDSACVEYRGLNAPPRYFYQYMEEKENWPKPLNVEGCE
jgi:hypothetical protein